MRLQRRSFVALAGMLAISAGLDVAGAETNMSRVSAHAFAFKSLDGKDVRLAAYAGKPILIVNTASLCGYTPQYAGLQELWTRYSERGLLILGVPSNDFGGQEPGGTTEIKRGPTDTPRWNFHKYLIGRDGRIKASFPSAVAPNDPRLIAALEKELAE